MPASRGNTPVTALIRVDLPAPFSPSSAWIWRARKVKSTACKARRLPTLLLSPRTASRAGPGSEAAYMPASLPPTFASHANAWHVRLVRRIRREGLCRRARGWLETRRRGVGRSVAEAFLAVVDLL